jgi:hypothetical protein
MRANEWSARNLLYSMRYNTGCGVLVPTSGQRQVVFEDMKLLCKQYFPDEHKEIKIRFAVPADEMKEDDDELELEEELDEDKEASISDVLDEEKGVRHDEFFAFQEDPLQGNSIGIGGDPQLSDTVSHVIEDTRQPVDLQADMKCQVMEDTRLAGAPAESDETTAQEESKHHVPTDQEMVASEELKDEPATDATDASSVKNAASGGSTPVDQAHSIQSASPSKDDQANSIDIASQSRDDTLPVLSTLSVEQGDLVQSEESEARNFGEDAGDGKSDSS